MTILLVTYVARVLHLIPVPCARYVLVPRIIAVLTNFTIYRLGTNQDNWIDDKTQLKEHIRSAFQQRFTTCTDPIISPQDAEVLTAPYC